MIAYSHSNAIFLPRRTQKEKDHAILKARRSEGVSMMATGRHVNRKYSIEELRVMLEPVFIKNGVKRAVLFGSYCRGDATANSDVDILVDSQLHGLAFFGLLEDLVNTLHKEVDLIDIRQIVEDSQIHSDIEKNGVVIYAA
jgi:uncharacterized protein